MPDEKSVPPFDLVVNLKDSGFSKDQIVDNLSRQGFSMQAIDDAFTQLDIKSAADVPAPQPGMQRSSLSSEQPFIPRLSSAPPSYSSSSQVVNLSSPSSASVGSDQVQELVESIIQEKWQRMVEEFGDL